MVERSMSSRCALVVLIVGALNISIVSGDFTFDPALPDGSGASFEDPNDMTKTNLRISEAKTNAINSSHPMELVKLFSTDSSATFTKVAWTPSTVQIEILSGVVTLKQPLDHEDATYCAPGEMTKDSCYVQLRVKETPTSTDQFILIYIDDFNDNPPQFLPNDCLRKSVKESEEGVELCSFEATDADTWIDSVLEISLKEHFDIFEMQKQDANGKKALLKILDDKSCDYEKTMIHSLTIVVTDSISDDPNHTAEYGLYVNVEDMPDMIPEWSGLRRSYQVKEKSTAGDLVLKLEALDGDRGVNSGMEYFITVTDVEDVPVNEYFTFNQANGELTVTGTLDTAEIMETHKSLIFQAEVIAKETQDPYAQSLPETISIEVVDENTHPPLFEDGTILKELNIDIEEDWLFTAPFASFVVADKDTDPGNNVFKAELQLPTSCADPDCGWFTDALQVLPPGQRNGWENFTLSIRAQGKVDYEMEEWRDPIQFKILIKNGINPDLTVTVNLKVIESNDNQPQWEYNDPVNNQFVLQVEENAPLNHPVGSVTATDADFEKVGEPQYGTQSLRYDWDPSSRPPKCLSINSESGEITVSQERCLDYEASESETFAVRVRDNMGSDGKETLSNIATVQLEIIDVNDEAPTIRLNTSTPTVRERQKENSEVSVIITVTDADAKEGDLVCTLTPAPDTSTDGTAWFDVHEDCSAIFVKGDVDREFNKAGGNGDGSGDPIDRVEMILTVTDRGMSPPYVDSDSIPITFKIKDIQDEVPRFDNYDYNDILETKSSDPTETPARRRIATILAVDDDSNSTFCFTVTMTSVVFKPSEILEIDGPVCGESSPGAGKLIISRNETFIIDREDDSWNYLVDVDGAPYLYFNVTVCNVESCELEESPESGKSDPLEIWVKIEDRNDEIPKFDDGGDIEFTIFENWNQNPASCSPDKEPQINTNISAQDGDECSDKSSYGCVRYRLTPQNTQDQEPFTLDEDTGELTTVECTIDFDTMTDKTYTVTVTAYDDESYNQPGNNKETKTITVTVVDINDNSPIFKTDPNKVSEGIFAQMKEEETVLVDTLIEITDADSGVNSQLEANITNVVCLRNGEICPVDEDDLLSFFELTKVEQEDNSHTLKLEIQPTSDFDSTDAFGLYCIAINATDGGEPPLTGASEYCIEVLDMNNHYPVWQLEEKVNGSKYLVSESTSEANTPLKIHNTTNLLPKLNATDDDDPAKENSQLSYKIATAPELFQEYVERNQENGQLYWKKKYVVSENENAVEFNITVVVSDAGSDQKSSDPLIFTIRIVGASKSLPEFNPLTQKLSILENVIGDVGKFSEATDDDIIGQEGDDIIYYHIMNIGNGGVGNTLFELQNNQATMLRTKVKLDREAPGGNSYDIIIFASNNYTSPEDIPSSPPEDDTSYLRITVEIGDENDCAPEFGTQFISAGISTDTVVGTAILGNDTILAIDADLNSTTGYNISSTITRSDKSLNGIPEPPFTLEPTAEEGAQLAIKFEPQTSMAGFFSFNITAYDKDKPELSRTVPCQIYLVKEDNYVNFIFFNNQSFVKSKRSQLQSIFSEALEYQCNIDSILQTSDGNGVGIDDQTTVKSHFVDTSKNEPLSKKMIEAWQFQNPAKLGELMAKLKNENLNLNAFSNQQPESSGTDNDKIVLYILVAGCGVLVAILVILSVTFLFRHRSMARQVRALRAGADVDPQTLNLDQKGLNPILPNTNTYAIKGSNPIFTEVGDGKKFTNFDAESIASGGSSLVGVEQQDDFKDHDNEANDNPAFEDEFNSSADEGDMYGMGSIRNPAYNPDYQEIGGESNYDYPAHRNPGPIDPLASISRRNPLAGMGLDEE